MFFPPEERIKIIENIGVLEFHNGLDWFELQKSCTVNKIFTLGSMEFFIQLQAYAQIFLSVIDNARIKIKGDNYLFKKGCAVYILKNLFVYRESDLISTYK